VAKNLKYRASYQVVFERDDNNRWFVCCPDLPGAHSHGRTLAAARANIREAIGVVLDLDDDAVLDLQEVVRLPDPQLQKLVDRARELRDSATEAEDKARRATIDAVVASTGSSASLSLRDLADLLGLSHQRVQQLATGTLSRSR
jgi:predicted RNase H-like HicB family nuclease